MARKPMNVQSVLVDASRYSLEAAKKKVKKMGYKVTAVDKPEEGDKQQFYRFRQRDPGQFEKFRNQPLTRKKKDGTEEETGVQLVLAKSVHLLVKAGVRGGKYLKRVPKEGGGFRYVYHSEKHRVAYQAEKMLVRAKALKARAKSLEANDMLAQAGKARDKANMLIKLARKMKRDTEGAVQKAVGARPHKYVKRIAKPGGGFSYVYAEPKGEKGKHTRAQKIFNSLRDARSAHKAGDKEKAEASIKMAYEESIKRNAETMKEINERQRTGKMSAEGAAAAKRVIADGTKIIGDKIRAVEKEIKEPVKARKEITPAERKKVLAFEERAGFRVAQPLDWAVKEHGLTEAEKNNLAQQFREHMPHFTMTSDPEKNRARASMIFNHWAEAAKMARKREATKPGDGHRYVEEAYHAGTAKEKAHITRAKKKYAEAKTLRLQGKSKEAEEAEKVGTAQLRLVFKQRGKYISPTQMREAVSKTVTTRKSFTEEDSMTDELSLSQREGERIAIEVRGGEEARAEEMAKAVLEVPVHGKTKKKSIPDERLLAIFKAHVRTEYRNAIRYNEGINAQSIYDRVLSSAEYNHTVEAALGVLEKRKTPFSVEMVKECIREVYEAKEEAGKVAPEPTERSSVIASGG